MSFKKILIIRLSSIGDIVLTSPVVRALKEQTDASIYFLTKESYVNVLINNPYIKKVFSVNDVVEVLNKKFDLIVDLQKNLKSFFISILIKDKMKKTLYISYNKENIKKWILINFKKNFLKYDHVVDRYFSELKKINIKNDNKGIDFFIPSDINKISFSNELPLEKNYIAWVIGGTYKQKKISKEIIIKVCSKISIPVIFIGGMLEKKIGEYICKKAAKPNLYNLCGSLSLDKSAFIIKNSSIVLTNDTGMMHIACAFQKKIISFWGCTKPSLGMYPYTSNENNIFINSNISSFPCSKLGNKCLYSKDGCINNIKVKEILIAIDNLT